MNENDINHDMDPDIAFGAEYGIDVPSEFVKHYRLCMAPKRIYDAPETAYPFRFGSILQKGILTGARSPNIVA